MAFYFVFSFLSTFTSIHKHVIKCNLLRWLAQCFTAAFFRHKFMFHRSDSTILVSIQFFFLVRFIQSFFSCFDSIHLEIIGKLSEVIWFFSKCLTLKVTSRRLHKKMKKNICSYFNDYWVNYNSKWGKNKHSGCRLRLSILVFQYFVIWFSSMCLLLLAVNSQLQNVNYCRYSLASLIDECEPNSVSLNNWIMSWGETTLKGIQNLRYSNLKVILMLLKL